MALTVMPGIAITRTWASKRLVKREPGLSSQGIPTVEGPCSRQSARGTAQCTTVSYCQMSRWRQERSRVS